MKKIIAVNASPRRDWNTGTLICEAANGAESAGVEVNDYDRYNWTMFDARAEKERHETVFPLEKQIRKSTAI